jgi:hypothetical protein
MTGVGSSAEAKDFPLASASRPALTPTQLPIQWIPGSFPGGKARPGRDADPHLVPKSRMSRNYLYPLPLRACMASSGTGFLLLPSGLFPSRFQPKPQIARAADTPLNPQLPPELCIHAFFISPMRSTCAAQLLFHTITIMMFVEEYELWRSCHMIST